MKPKESDAHEGGQEGNDSVRIKLGMKDHLALSMALLETVAIPLLVVMAVLLSIVFLAFR